MYEDVVSIWLEQNVIEKICVIFNLATGENPVCILVLT